jgi:glycosyltransferase involved in cell wall biosynthesis
MTMLSVEDTGTLDWAATQEQRCPVAGSLRVGIVWPKPRRDRWRAGRASPDRFPDLSDALLYLDREGIEVSIEESLGFPWNPFAATHEFYSGLDPIRAARVAARLRHYDAVICVGDATAFVLLWLRERFRFRLPIVIVDPALSYDYPKRKRIQDYVLPRAESVVVFGRSQLDYLDREYGSRVRSTFMHHRVDTDFYRPSSTDSRPATQPYVLSVGNDYSRDFETLAAATRRCAAMPGFDHRFIVLSTRAISGAGSALEVRRDKVSYVDLRALYAGASVVVLPLHDMVHAGGINTLLEAMSMACPLVVSASRGIADYVRPGETAVSVGVADPDALTAAIVRLTRDRAEASRMGRNARRFVLDTCDNRLYAKEMASVVRRSIAACAKGT